VKSFPKHFLIGLLLPASLVAAQEFTGRVSDPTGAVLPNARVVAHNLDTNISTATVATAAGDYTIPYLNPGNYTVSAEAKGFERGLHTGIVLEVGQTATVNFRLAVGRSTETVTVSGDALLDLGKADTGEVVENARVTELPLNGRDPDMLSILNAGAIWTGSIQWQRPFDDTMENLSINGGGSSYNELMLDGMSNEAAATNNTTNSKIAYVPPVDSVQEFKIITNPYDAQYGRLAGGVVDMTLKSGTNTLHGDVYEFTRQTFLDANTWQNDWLLAQPGNAGNSEYSTAAMKWNQYGAELDGPVVVPKIYDGRSKSFFLLQYENFHEVVPNSLITSVPDPAWLTGDFSNLSWYNSAAGANQPIILYDPATLDPVTLQRQPFPKNMISTLRFNPVAKAIMSYFPAPNIAPAPNTNSYTNNFATPNPTTDEYRNVIGKIDRNLTSKDRASLRYGYWEREEFRNTNGMPPPLSEGELPHGERAHTFALEETHTFRPNLLFDFRAVVAVRADYTMSGATFDPTALGWSGGEIGLMGPAAGTEFPIVQASEFAEVGNNGNSQTVSNSLSLFPTVTWVKGKHTLRAGLDGRFMQSSNNIIGGGPYFWVDRTWTQSNYIPADWTNNSGNSFASLLLGNATSGNDSINTKVFWSQHYWAPFVQDDWKVSHRLTLNLGIRYDLNPSAVERHNNGDYAFDTTVVNPIDSQVSMPNGQTLHGGVTFLGVNGNPREAYALTKTNIQPRVGFAYAMSDDMVLRGGFGETFRNPQPGANTLGYSSTTNYTATLNGYQTPYTEDNLGTPFASGISQPTGSSLGLLTDLGQGPWFLNSHYTIPSFWNYSMGIEHSFLKHDTLNIAYVGTHSFNVDGSDNINHESGAAWAKCNQDMGGNPSVCNNDYPANPFYGIAAFNGSGYNTAPTLQGLNFTRPFPEFGDIIEYQENTVTSWYNSLQVTGVHKMSNSLTAHGTWTWSKLMDAGGWADETYRIASRHIDGNDRTHRVTLSFVYVLPVGRGRALLGESNRIVDGVIGGWELGSLYIYETGWPWGVPNNPNERYLHSAFVPRQIDHSTGYIRGVAACVEQWNQNSSGAWYEEQLPFNYSGTCSQPDFSVQPQYGALANTIFTGIRVPSDQQFDANLSKNFNIAERMKLQLRLEAFNAANHPLWQEAYSGSAQDTNFGTIERGPWGQSNLPREVQIALKLMW
jgi:Carboxypeptidase regulatory-like domain/TonB dependent receptor